jgi:hypothetical protein
MFAALTSVSEPHHQATGFDQASVLGRGFDRARHSILIRRPTCCRIDMWV